MTDFSKFTTKERWLIRLAAWFSIITHRLCSNRRKYTGEPYWVHCRDVADLVGSKGGNAQQIAAAWLHDTVEDTFVSQRWIRWLFGRRVGQLVFGLTDQSKKTDGNRAVRKAIDRRWVASQPAECRFIKLADIMCNTVDIAFHDPKFAKIYLIEVSLLMDHLRGLNAEMEARVDMITASINKDQFL